MNNPTDLIALILCVITAPGTFYLLFITLIGSISFLQKKRTEKLSAIRGSKIAIIIPAHNEANIISDTISSVQHCDSPVGTFDIFVIADNCDDDTAAVASASGCNVIERKNRDLKGKGYALNFAFTELEGSDYDLFLVLDADTLCEENLLTEIEAKCTAGADAIQTKNLISPTTSRYSELTSIGFRAMNVFRPKARQLMGFSTGLFGTGFALTKKTIKQVPYTSSSITEDLHYHLLLVTAGLKVEFAENTGISSTMPNNDAAAKQQRGRWEGGRLRLIRDGVPLLSKSLLRGNMSSIEPLIELLLLPLSYHLCLLGLILLLPSSTLNGYSLVAMSITLMHVLCVIAFTGNGLKQLRVLLQVPGYIVWKIRIALNTLKQSKAGAQWIRTKRDE